MKRETINREIIDKLVSFILNDQDKFIIECLWNGLYGIQLNEISSLKIADIDFKNKKINKNFGKSLDLEDKFFVAANKAIKQKYYLKMNEGGSSNPDYELADSDFLIKVKPTVKNSFGMCEIGYDALRDRMTKIAKEAKSILKNVENKFTAKDIYHAGIVNRLIKKQETWVGIELDAELKKTGYRCSGHRIKKLLIKTVSDNNMKLL